MADEKKQEVEVDNEEFLDTIDQMWEYYDGEKLISSDEYDKTAHKSYYNA